ncbi:hypothetical protein VNO80_18374 [Phaseolus coccineus]|uniref:Uncharacterized protein n=1 Tax=Phaseolus coccineus TaxID=3886 RepID=A0AAN9MKB5_PHACN
MYVCNKGLLEYRRARTHTVLCLLLYFHHYYHSLNVSSPTKQICSNIYSGQVGVGVMEGPPGALMGNDDSRPYGEETDGR